VLVQWTRAEEFAFGPARPSVVARVAAALDGDGRISGWRYDETTSPHTYSGELDPRFAAMTAGRNAVPAYRLPTAEVTLHVASAPIRTSAFRSLAGAPNVFAIESTIDDLARAIGEDPLAFRLRHLDNPRMHRVLQTVAARCGWATRPADGGGRALGLACADYSGTPVAQVAEVEVDGEGRARVLRAWCAIDPGTVVDPDGVRNQVEGGIQQAASWTLLEEVRVRDGRVVTTDWERYPIATFTDALREIDVAIVGDEGAPFNGVGEPGMVPAAAAIANAVRAACGARVRELPLRPDRIRAARS
jgi:CO/xanthine dehydrogenase Mo-binding subunit